MNDIILNKVHERTIRLLKEDFQLLRNAKIIVIGTGGVGGAVSEALARAGIGHLTLLDFDTVDISNLNRQVFTDFSNIGRLKPYALKEKILKYSPSINVKTIIKKLNTQNITELNLKNYDYICDCIDNVSAKLALINFCYFNNLHIISAMGAGDKIDATKLTVTDIFSTNNDPLSRVIRRELRKRKIKKLKVVYSSELGRGSKLEDKILRKATVGTISVMPQTCGLLMASEVIKDILNFKRY